MEVATFAGGCFWCTEAVFLEIKGVEKVVSGYIGGKTVNPTYKDICTGETGHAEAIQITFNPNEVAYEDLLEVFKYKILDLICALPEGFLFNTTGDPYQSCPALRGSGLSAD